MIIHLPKNITHAQAQEYAQQVGALCFEKADYFVLVTNHAMKQQMPRNTNSGVFASTKPNTMIKYFIF